MTLKEFLEGIADAIRGKEGSAADIPAAQFAPRISAIQTGVELPVLTDPAEENDIRDGKEYIDASGKKQRGRLKMDGVWTPDWSAYIPIHVGYDSDDRYLVMDNMDGIGGGLETVNVTFTIYGPGTIYYMGADGIAMLTSPYEETVAVIKNSPVIIWYENPGGTYLIGRYFNGGTYIMGNAGSHNGSSCDILTFQEDGNALYEEV